MNVGLNLNIFSMSPFIWTNYCKTSGHPYYSPNKREEANIASKKWFCYLNPFFSQGWKHGITESDISLPQKKAESGLLADKLRKYWDEETQKDDPKLWRALARAFLPEVVAKCSGIWLSEIVRFFQAFILSWLIGAFQRQDMLWSFIWAGVFGFSSIFWALAYHRSV